uniref:Uncharacterized protein n=1 Tax=Rhizophora mucronata TaxID=61149 RepID=A0A2P2J172_RHIMU
MIPNAYNMLRGVSISNLEKNYHCDNNSWTGSIGKVIDPKGFPGNQSKITPCPSPLLTVL